MELLAIAVLFVLVFVLVKRLTKKKKSGAGTYQEAQVEKWARAEVCRLLATRLELEESDVSATLNGNPDPDLVTRLERTVLQIEVVYERALGAAGHADVRVDVKLESGDVERSTKRVTWAELPVHVQDEFAKTGTAHVYRPWAFPWQQS